MDSHKEDDIDVDFAEIKKVLEEANMYEPDMPMDVMISFYKALTNSKSTASEEDETRKFTQSREDLKKQCNESTKNDENNSWQSKEKPFHPKIWTSEKKMSVDRTLEHNNNVNNTHDILKEIVNDLPKDATKTVFGFNEMLEDSDNTLSIITHELKFVPIQSSSEFLNSGIAVRTKMLYAYHTKVINTKTKLAKSSFYPAPLPKITRTTKSFSNSFENELPETYICRSGRQTKRKIYNYDDDEDSLDDSGIKKIKNSEEQESLQSKNSGRTNKKQEANKVITENRNPDPQILGNLNSEKKPIPKKEPRKPQSRKMSNVEIMKRSKIFTVTPKKRCEMMFDRLKEDEEKNVKSNEIELEILDSESNKSASPIDHLITEDDDQFVRRRVIPPIPGRKMINRKRNNSGLAPLDIKLNSPNQKKVPPKTQIESSSEENFIPKNSVNKESNIHNAVIASSSSDNLPSTSRITKTVTSKDVSCPICDDSFREEEIESKKKLGQFETYGKNVSLVSEQDLKDLEHAATCGDDTITRSKSKISRITCDICDTIVDFNTDFEVHVKNCISKKRGKD